MTNISLAKLQSYKNVMPKGLYSGKMPNGDTYKMLKKNNVEYNHHTYRPDGSLKSTLRKKYTPYGLKTTFTERDQVGNIISKWSAIG